jgi:dihydrodipicolinate synthase/N-acetylneuraminate lyase
MYRLFREGRFDEARALHFTLSRLNGAVSGTYGVAGVKAAMDAAGYRGGEPRHPLVPVPAEAREAIRRSIADAGFRTVS